MMVVGQQDISSMQQQQAADAWRQALVSARASGLLLSSWE